MFGPAIVMTVPPVMRMSMFWAACAEPATSTSRKSDRFNMPEL
jgi:hypothetical protein